MYEHNALGFWSGLALCLTKVRSSRARCPATALIFLPIKNPKMQTVGGASFLYFSYNSLALFILKLWTWIINIKIVKMLKTKFPTLTP